MKRGQTGGNQEVEAVEGSWWSFGEGVSKVEVVKTPSQQQQAISLGKIILTKRQTSLMEKRKSSTIYVYLFSSTFPRKV